MKLLLLINPSSCGGSGKKLWNRLFSALDEKGVEYQKHILSNIEEAFELAKTASETFIFISFKVMEHFVLICQ